MAAAPHYTSDLASRVGAFPFWYHRIQLPGGVVTPGWAPLAADAYRIPDDFSGLRVLDVGAWDGYWTFEALNRGAEEVVAIDDFSDFLGMPESVGRRAWDTFDLCRDALGYAHPRCQRLEMSIYEATPDRLGQFDVVFCFGVLYHLRHPLLALDFLSALCTDAIYIESAILDDLSPYQGGIGHGYPGAQPLMEFYPGSELGSNPTNWWSPTLACLGLMTMSAGWPDVEVWKLADHPTEAPQCRGFARGRKRPA